MQLLTELGMSEKLAKILIYFSYAEESYCADIEQGTYLINAKVRDVLGSQSNWGQLTVSMPKTKPIINRPFLRFLENHPHIFLILRILLQRLGL